MGQEKQMRIVLILALISSLLVNNKPKIVSANETQLNSMNTIAQVTSTLSPSELENLENRVKKLENDNQELKSKINELEQRPNAIEPTDTTKNSNINIEKQKEQSTPNKKLLQITKIGLALILLFLLFIIGFIAYKKLQKSKKNIKDQEKDYTDFREQEENKNSFPESLPPFKTSELTKFSYLEKISQPKNTPSIQDSNHNQIAHHSKSDYTENSSKTTKTVNRINDETDLVALYNKNPKALLNDIVVVSLTKDSFEKRRAGFDDFPLYFEKSASGNYWITLVPELPEPYYLLVPKGGLIINPPTYQTMNKIFDCVDYERRSSSKFTLHLATVVTCDKTGIFKLYEKGKLTFH